MAARPGWITCGRCDTMVTNRKGLMERHQKTVICQAVSDYRHRVAIGYERVGNGGLTTQLRNAGIEIAWDVVGFDLGFKGRKASIDYGPWVKKEIMDLYRARTQSAHAKARWMTLVKKKRES